ncbi:hypothetical protein V8E53_005004 [Lactarius tabidus]
MTSVLSSPPVPDVQILSPFPASSPTPAEIENRTDSNEADPSIFEALKSKERLFVLRVGGDMERLINERKGRVEIPTATSYQRLLVHRCSTYYRVIPESDSGSRSIWISFSLESRIPPKRISELVPVEQTKQPAIKIMSRSVQDRIRAQSQSRTGSVNGEDAESSDVEPSEAGSLGGRGGAPSRLKKALTLEQREAAYNEARSRIFMDFEEKAKEKENDMSASSSTFSLVSGSASTSGGGSSSAGDIDDSISTAPTESEFSGPVARDSKGERRNGSGTNSAGSSRSMLPPKHPSSSRNSRAPSPSITYASIYEPSPAPYDTSQVPQMQPPYGQQFMFPYSPPPPPGQGPGQGFMGPMPPYYPYSYPQPPQALPPQHHGMGSDPSGSGADPQSSGMFVPPHHPQQMVYVQYPWPPNPASGAPPPASHPGTPSHPHPHSSQQYQFAPATAPQYGYNVPAYFPSMGPPMHAPPQGQQPLQQPTHPVNMSPLPQSNDLGIRVMPPIPMNNDHTDPRGRKRGNSRTSGGSFSYAPAFGYPGPFGGPGPTSPIENGASPVGPRLNSAMRRTSGTSNGSRTPGDEASSVTSSTSSSSRTTSSQHPLPPRPDWAVGLKPNPTLHQTRPSARNGGPRNHTTSAPPVLLQPADFPPLGGGARAPPGPSGVWTSGAGKAREPVGGAHCGGGDGVVERTPSKGVGMGPKAPRLASASAPLLAPGGGSGEGGFVMQDLADGVSALALGGKEQS